MTERAAIVLAGGFSTRFSGGDKTLAALSERPLIGHAVDNLDPVAAAIVVSCRREQRDEFAAVLPEIVDYALDETPDQGPLAGLAASLAVVDAATVAVATADMPCVPSALYRDLFDALDESDSDAVVVETEGVRQPAPAVYRTAALRAAVRSQQTAGDARLRGVFEVLSTIERSRERVIEEYGKRALFDVNTRTDLEALSE